LPRVPRPLIINDDLDLAYPLERRPSHRARRRVHRRSESTSGSGLDPGASCYNRSISRSPRGRGADYVAFGSAFASSTKPGAVRAPLSLYREAKTRLACPVVAIGGITSENARP